MHKFGCPDKFIAIVRAFHDGMMASVAVGGDETAPFNVELGVKIGLRDCPNYVQHLSGGSHHPLPVKREPKAKRACKVAPSMRKQNKSNPKTRPNFLDVSFEVPGHIAFKRLEVEDIGKCR